VTDAGSGGVAAGGRAANGGRGSGASAGAQAAAGGSAGAAAAAGGAGGTSSGGQAGTGSGKAGNSSAGASAAGGAGRGGTGGTPGGGAGGGAGAGGAGSGGANAAGSGGSSGRAALPPIFDECRFHFGTIDSIAKNNPSMIPELDFFTPGWMGQSNTFDMAYVCDEGNPGGELEHQVPVIVAYVAAFYIKRNYGLCDCNVTTCGEGNDLCRTGAARISEHLEEILDVYESYGQGFANCYGTERPIIFEMEPDFYQYTYTEDQTEPWSFQRAGEIMSQMVGRLKKHLPNAHFSLDISPWVGTNNDTGSNGSDQGANWYSYFDLDLFSFVNTSGGSTNAGSAQIRSNEMTWGGVVNVTGKPLLADTGYGANGSSAGPDPAWDTPSNINARIAEGVVSISQYNPSSNWGSTIASIRSQLSPLPNCP
jgi:hypothetical protein